MENCEKLLDEIKRIFQTFTKNPQRKFSAQNLLNKSTRLKGIHKEFQAQLANLRQSSIITEKEKDTLVEKFNSIFAKTKHNLNLKIEESYNETRLDYDSDSSSETSEEFNRSERLKMASFDIVTALKIIPEFSGEYKELDNFLKIIELYGKTLKDDSKKDLIDFVWNARLSHKAKNKIATAKTPTSLEELRTILKSNFKSGNTPQKIYSQLSELKQRNTGVKVFTDKVSTLINELNTLQIQEIGEENRETVTKLNDKLALNIFQNGLNENLKPTIFAAQCSKFSEAAALASQIEKPLEPQIFSFNKRVQNSSKTFNGNFRQTFSEKRNRFQDNGNRTNQIQGRYAYNNNQRNYFNRTIATRKEIIRIQTVQEIQITIEIPSEDKIIIIIIRPIPNTTR